MHFKTSGQLVVVKMKNDQKVQNFQLLIRSDFLYTQFIYAAKIWFGIEKSIITYKYDQKTT